MTRYITIHTTDGTFQAYLAEPRERATPVPAILVIQELFGVNADIRETCDEFAARGYLAVSPDLFWRQEPGIDLSPGSEADWRKGMALYEAFDLESGVTDIAATIKATRALPGSCGKIGLMGFCMGGLMTYLTSAKCCVDASVVYYGAGIDRYLDLASDIRTPMMMHFGGNDEFIPASARGAIRAALAGNPCVSIFTYSDQRHAFARHGGAHFDIDSAERANHRTRDFFARHLLERRPDVPRPRPVQSNGRTA